MYPPSRSDEPADAKGAVATCRCRPFAVLSLGDYTGKGLFSLSEISYVLANFVDVLLTVLVFAIFVRAILSWFPVDEDGPLVSFVYLITDPVIVPIRAFWSGFPFFRIRLLTSPAFSRC